MGQIAVSVTKRVAFRDSVQEFSNVYNYLHIGLDPQPSLSEQFVDAVVAVERELHATSVTFIRARVWTSGGTKAENRMIYQKVLTGTGTGTPLPAFDKERSYLIQWPAGKDSRGKQVYLKKWYHACGLVLGFQIAEGVLGNQESLTAAARAALVAGVKALSPLTIGSQQYAFMAEGGRLTEGLPPIAHRYLEHHQLGDQWRG